MTDERLRRIVDCMDGYCPDYEGLTFLCQNRWQIAEAQETNKCVSCWAKAIKEELERDEVEV